MVKIYPKYLDFTPLVGYEDSWRPVEARGFLYDNGEKFPNDRSEPRQRLATRVMSNGVEVIVANGKEGEDDKTTNTKSKLLRIMTSQESEKITTLVPTMVKNNVRMTVAPEDQARKNHTSPKPHKRQQQSLLSSSMSTAYVPYHQNTKHPQHPRHNFVIKTCFTTYTYLTTTVQKMRTTVSTYETVISTVTTEPIELATATEIEVQPTQTQLFQSTKAAYNTPVLMPKIEKRIDESHSNFDAIQPSEPTPSCSMTSCPCTVTFTESLKDNLKTKSVDDAGGDDTPLQLKRSPLKPTKYGSTIVDIAPTAVDYKIKHKDQSRPSTAPSEKVVQKYTEVINEPSNDSIKKNDKNKLSNKPVGDSEKINNRRNETKTDDNKPTREPEKNKEPTKINKNKFEVTDLLKLGIKSLAPMIQKMQWMDLIRGQEQDKLTTTTTVKPVTQITPYIVNKRHDDFVALSNDQKTSASNQFPIYIPVEEKDIETAESQNIYYNSTLQQNLSWNSQNSKTTLGYGKPIHESPLLNGGIPISPGEIITANSDVIVGKPVVGGPNIGHINKSNMKPNNPPQNYYADSHPQGSIVHDVRAKPPPRGQGIKQIPFIRGDDSFDLRPPMMTMPKHQPPHPHKPNHHHPSGNGQFNQDGNNKPSYPHQGGNGQFNQDGNNKPNYPHQNGNGQFNQDGNNKPNHPHQNGNGQFNQDGSNKPNHQRPIANVHYNQDGNNKPDHPPMREGAKPHNVYVDHVGGSIHSASSILDNHGRPAFLDYIPALDSPGSYQNYIKNNLINRKTHDDHASHQNTLNKNNNHENKISFPHVAPTQSKKPKDTPESLFSDFTQTNTNQPFLVDVQPSRVANVIIPHGSSTALIFAGTSEPHKNGEYIDDPLPYPEPGYFGTFSIEAPHLAGGTGPIKANGPQFIIKEKPLTDQIGLHTHNPDPHVVNHGVSGLNKDINPPPGQRWKYTEFQNKKPQFQGTSKLPPPISTQQSNIQFGPHFINNRPDMEFGGNKITPPTRNQVFGGSTNAIRTTTADYEKDLAVPPPPPPTVQIQFESNVGVLNEGNRPMRPNIKPNNIPFVHHNEENGPPKITSEVYFASSSSHGGHNIKPFTVNIPAQPNVNRPLPQHHGEGSVQHGHIPFENTKFVNTFNGGLVTMNAGTKVNIQNPNFSIKPSSGLNTNHYNVPKEGGLITVNAGASVFNPNLPEQTISGSNGAVSHVNDVHNINVHSIKEFYSHEGESTGIPIGTNFAIKVEPQVVQEYNPARPSGMSTADFKPQNRAPEIIIGGNSWKAGTNEYDNRVGSDSVQNGNQKVQVVHATTYNDVVEEMRKNASKATTNSHANHPIVKDIPVVYNIYGQASKDNNRPIQQSSVEKYNDYYNKNASSQQRPILVTTATHESPKPTRDSMQNNQRFKPDTTTHKIIPLTFDYESERYGSPNKNVQFGQKIQSAGLPPTNYNWHQLTRPILKEKPVPNYISQFMAPPTITTPTYNPAYIPSNYNSNRQPVYNIPNRDDTTKTTFRPLNNTVNYIATNFVSNNNDYKTIDENDYTQKENGEFTQESMRIPVVSSTPQTLTNEVTVNFRPFKNTTKSTNEILISSENDYTNSNRKPAFNANDNTGSQTEKPFDNKYKNTPLVTLPNNRETTNPTYKIPNFTQMAPRPFSVSDNKGGITNIIHYEIDQPRPFQKPADIDQDRLVLNIGEVPAKPSTTEKTTQANNQRVSNLRPQISIKNNSLTYKNEIDKIITSTVNVATKRPFRVSNITTEKTTTLPTFTIPNKYNSSTVISNLSPPPPTMDYSFKPTNNDDESIVGMSPPPKTPAPKIPDYTKGDLSTYRPGHNSMKNQYKRPGDYYRITSRPFSRYTTPSTPGINRIKVTPGTTITRIVFPSRSSVPSWKNPGRVETKLPKPTRVTVINTTPLATVGSNIMHPDIYPEETIGMINPSVIKSDVNIAPDRVQKPPIVPTSVKQTTKVKPSSLPYPSIQASENFYDENAIRKTEILKAPSTIKDGPVKTSIYQFTPPSIQSSFSSIDNEVTIKPVHHAGNEIIPSDDDVMLTNPEMATAITLTTTINQPASTVMTTRFVTLTHTLTVTQTQTSIVKPEVGSTTQTLVLTNTKTSTVVDVVTQIQTLVQPVTIVQTITKHIPITTLASWETKYPKVPIEPTQVREYPYKTKEVIKLDDVSLSSDEEDFIITPPDNSTSEVELSSNETHQEDDNTFFVVMNKSQNGGRVPNILPPEDSDTEQPTRNEDVGHDGVSHVLLGEILLAGTPYLESTNPVSPTGVAYGKECQPDCKASRNERCQRMHGLMKCVCRPGFARMFPDRPCKPTYTYAMKMALSRYGKERLYYQDSFADQNTKDFQDLAMAAHEGINRMVMQSDLRDVYHGVHINGFQPVKIPTPEGSHMNGVLNDFYVQLSDNAHETRLKEVIEKYLRHNNYSLGGTDVYAAGELVDKLEVGDFNECMSGQFHDCSEHAECFNLRATYTCSCKEGYADLSVNPLYPGRICSAEPVGCEKCNYHGTCYTRDDSRVLCECFQWYSGENCHINLKVILISLATLGAILFTLLLICLIMTCAKKRRPKGPKRSQIPPNVMTACIGNLPAIHQVGIQSSKMHSTMDKRALIQERGNDSGGEGSSIHNASLPYIPTKKISQASHKSGKKSSTSDMSSHEKKPFTLMIPRAKYHPTPSATALMMSSDARDNGGKRKSSGESSNETKLLSYLDAGPSDNLGRRKQSNESSYSMNKSIPQKYSTGALISAGFKVSTTVMGDHDSCLKDIPDDESSVAKSNTLPTLDMQSQFNSLRKAYSQEDINDWTDAERRIGELTMSEARSFDGTLVKPSTKLMRSTTGSNKSSAHYTQHEANTMAERDLGSTFLLPHVHLYKPDMGSDVSEFDSL